MNQYKISQATKVEIKCNKTTKRLPCSFAKKENSNYITQAYFIECSQLQKERCNEKAKMVYTIDDTCYYTYAIDSPLSLHEQDKFCQKKNLTLANYPTSSIWSVIDILQESTHSTALYTSIT